MDVDTSFPGWCQHHNRTFPKKMVRVLIPGFALWWPFDLVLFREQPAILNAFFLMRSGALSILVLYLILGKWTRINHRFPLGMPAAGMAILSTWVPFCFGKAGDMSEPWFHWLYLGICAPVALFMSLSQRAVLTLVCMVLAYLGWYLARPDMLSDPYLGVSISYTLFAVLVSIWTGEQITSFANNNWRQERKMDEQARTLHQQIEAQTSRLRTLATHLSATQENERRRLSQDLHDEFGQELAGIRYAIATLKRKYQQDPTIVSNLQELEKQAAHLAETVRNILLDLRPRVLEDLGLQAALEWLAERVSRQGETRVRFLNDGTEINISHLLGLTIYRFVQEALTNVIKHADARNVTVDLSWQEGHIHIKISDDGQGFDTSQPVKGMGILGMRERLHGLGGQLDVISAPGKGTTLEGVVPAHAALLVDASGNQTA